MLSRVLHLPLAAALAAGGVTILVPLPAQAANVDAALVATRSTSAWGRPSPDPAGITYNPSTGQLIISDSEVEETPLYAGTNLFVSSLTGVQDAAFPGGTTLPSSDEPTGVAYKSDGSLFVSDDDNDRVFQFRAGADGRYGTGDDDIQSFSTRPVATNGDAEDVTVDMDVATAGHLLVVDGVNTEVYDYGPGPNGVFDAVGAGGDDTVTQFDVGRFGALDPEGIEYYEARNTILVLDGGSKTVYELNRQGELLNAVSIAAASPKKAAGMTLAPASNGSGARNLYIVDRGTDNDSDPAENDGRFYEMTLPLPPLSGGPVNRAPSVNAGPDRGIFQTQAAALSGSVTDDGLPNPPAAVSLAWSKVSGPGSVAFANPAVAATTATFSTPGSYVLRLAANDGSLLSSDDMSVQVTAGDGSSSVDIAVSDGSDDAEERSASTSVTGTDLELVVDAQTTQTVGIRFRGVAIPQGATITNAYIQFQAVEVQTGPVSLTVAGQAADDTAPFTAAAGSVSSRPRTSATVAWQPAPWTTGARGVEQRTPDLSSVVSQIVSRAGWASGHSMAFVVTGSGTRTAQAFEGEGSQLEGPVLHVDFRTALPGAPAGEQAIQRYIIKVYNDLFHRAPDPTGLATWTSLLSTGTPYGEVANGITYSREFRSRLIAESYQHYLGRGPDAAGLEGWLGGMARGMHIEQMQSGFISSPEFYAAAGSDDRRWIAALYQTVLGRSPGVSEVDFWQRELQAGASKNGVALGFLYSTEHLTTVVNGYYLDLLHRSIDPTGRQTWVSLIQQGHRDEEIIAAIVSSAEYRQSV